MTRDDLTGDQLHKGGEEIMEQLFEIDSSVLRSFHEEIQKLRMENNQLLSALGYEVPADTPPSNYKCGMCNAMQAENATLKNKLAAIINWLEQKQPDVFARGLWDAIREAQDASR